MNDSRYSLLMIFYLVTGVLGLLFVIGEELDRVGWLEPMIRSLFGQYADGVLENLYGLEILFTFIIVPLIPFALIYCLCLAVLFPTIWSISLPALVLLFLSAIFLVGVFFFNLESSGTLISVLAIASVVYFLMATFVGIRWLVTGNNNGWSQD